jgi:EAL and modified HD-GYP domain-containing signal transduction protein
LQRWLQLLVFASGSQNGTSNPLLLMAATRGRLMELLAAESRPGDAALADQAFMTGIMSLMPALVGQPIADIVAPLGLTGDIRDALCAGSGTLGALLRIAESSEDGDMLRLTQALAELPGLGPKAINRAQTQALQWANDIGREKQP